MKSNRPLKLKFQKGLSLKILICSKRTWEETVSLLSKLITWDHGIDNLQHNTKPVQICKNKGLITEIGPQWSKAVGNIES